MARSPIKIAALFPLAAFIAGCEADKPDSDVVKAALSAAISSEASDKDIGALPFGKTFTVSMNSGDQIVTAKKAADIIHHPECGLFDVIVAPSSSGNTKKTRHKNDVEICLR